MEPGHHIKSLLQFQLGSDSSSIKSISYCLSTLTSESLEPSSHVTKWTNRISSLMLAKEPAARWAGLCLAYKTSLLRQEIMVDRAQSWIVVALPLLSKNESIPVLKAALRLLKVIFTTPVNLTEFKRQVTVPNVLKLTPAVISLAENHSEPELKLICLKTLQHLVVVYPTIVRHFNTKLSSFCLHLLSDSLISCSTVDIKDAASGLYSILHLTGGKVGSISLWRKSIDDTLAFGWDALTQLRTTFKSVQDQQQRPSTSADAQDKISINLNRLRSSVLNLCNLLSTIINRPVHVPIGELVRFAIHLSTRSGEDKVEGFTDPLAHSMEVAIIPDIVSLGCDLIMCLSRRFPFYLIPHLSRLLTISVTQLEQSPNPGLRLKILQTLESLLRSECALHSESLCGRVVKAVLPPIIRMLTPSPANFATSPERTKSGKKRTRNFEGEEVFKGTYEISCPTHEDCEAILISIEILGHLLKNPALSSALASIVARVIVALLVSLPKSTFTSSLLDPNFVATLTKKLQTVGFRIGSGTTNIMSKSLPFIIGTGFPDQETDIQRNLELLLHPRVPPLVRTVPFLETLSLLKTEESSEEAATLSSLTRFYDQNVQSDDLQEDTLMKEINPTPVAESNQPPLTPPPPPLSIQSSEVLPQQKGNVPIPDRQSPEQIISHPTTNNAPLTSHFDWKISNQASPVPIHQKPSLIVPEEEEEDIPVINMSSDSEIEEDV